MRDIAKHGFPTNRKVSLMYLTQYNRKGVRMKKILCLGFISFLAGEENPASQKA